MNTTVAIANAKVAIVALTTGVMLYGTAVHATGFGGLEAAYTRDDNFTGAPAGSPKTAESIMTYSGFAGKYWPSASQRSAWILKADAAFTRLDKFDVLDSKAYGLSTGVFHKFSQSNSITTMVGAHSKQFDDNARDYDLYTLQVSLKQKTSDKFFFREGLVVEKASAEVQSNEYDGAGLNVSLNWTPSRASLLTLGAGRIERDYDVAVANKRTHTFATVGFVYQLGKYVYVRGGATRQDNRTNADTEYDSNLYTVAFGVGL